MLHLDLCLYILCSYDYVFLRGRTIRRRQFVPKSGTIRRRQFVPKSGTIRRRPIHR